MVKDNLRPAANISSAVLRKAWRLLGTFREAESAAELLGLFHSQSQPIIPHDSFFLTQSDPPLPQPLFNNVPASEMAWKGYQEYYYSVDPLRFPLSNPKVFNIHLPFPGNLPETEYYRDHLQQYLIKSAMVLKLRVGSSSCIGGVIRLNGSKMFAGKDSNMLNMLIPHLAYYTEMCELRKKDFSHIPQKDQAGIGLMEPCQSPMWKLGLDFSTQWANGAAEALMQSWGDKRRTIKGKCLFETLPRDVQGLLWSVRNLWNSLQSGEFTHDAPSRRIKVEAAMGTFVFNAAILPPANSECAAILMTAEVVSASETNLPVIVSFGLTMREKEIAALVAEGLSNSGICDKVSLSLDTVKQHISSILRKTDSRNRSAAVKKLYLDNMIQ